MLVSPPTCRTAERRTYGDREFGHTDRGVRGFLLILSRNLRTLSEPNRALGPVRATGAHTRVLGADRYLDTTEFGLSRVWRRVRLGSVVTRWQPTPGYRAADDKANESTPVARRGTRRTRWQPRLGRRLPGAARRHRLEAVPGSLWSPPPPRGSLVRPGPVSVRQHHDASQDADSAPRSTPSSGRGGRGIRRFAPLSSTSMLVCRGSLRVSTSCSSSSDQPRWSMMNAGRPHSARTAERRSSRLNAAMAPSTLCARA
jgi:hypothetical protein